MINMLYFRHKDRDEDAERKSKKEKTSRPDRERPKARDSYGEHSSRAYKDGDGHSQTRDRDSKRLFIERRIMCALL